jgi:hypothetical protein
MSADAPLIAAATAAEVAGSLPLSDEARTLLEPTATPARYVETLRDRGLHPDAVRVLAHALPKREGVWWACRCVREAGTAAPGPASEALAAAEKWVAEPDEPNRRTAETAARAAGAGTPAGLAALAAFWSGGSLAPAEFHAVPPAEDLTARGVTGAVMLAAASGPAPEIPARYRRYLDLGLDVAAGRDRPPGLAPAIPPPPEGPTTAPRPASKPTRRIDSWE